MTENTTQQQVADANTKREKSEADKARDKAFDSVKRVIFRLPEQGDAATTAANNARKVATDYGLAVGTNIPEEGVPAGYVVAVLPLKDKVENVGHVLRGVYIGCFPSADTAREHEKGAEFISNVVLEKFANKLVNAVSSLKKGEQPNSVPYSVGDFVVPMRTADEGLAAYRELAKDMVALLTKKGLKKLDVNKLRSCLSSKAFAENEYRDVTDQGVWVRVLDVLIKHATEQGLSTKAFENWKQTRDETAFETGSISLDDLADLA